MRARVASFYFLYFGVLGLYLPYFNLYCKDLGFSGFEIGLISSIQPCVRLASPVFWGLVADRLGRTELLIRAFYLGAIASFSALLWVKEFPALFTAITVYTFFIVPVFPIWESTVLELLAAAKKDYGRIRIWGSFGFIALSLTGGLALNHAASSLVIDMILGLSILNFVLLRLNPVRTETVSGPWDLGWMRSRNLVVFLLACALMHASHGTYYGFFTIYVTGLGNSTFFSGVLWSAGVFVEVVVMIFSGPLIARFGRLHLLRISLAAAVARWILTAYITSGPALILIQGLHGLTFGLFHVCAITLVGRLVPRGYQATAQSLHSSATYGVGGLAGFLLNAFFYDVAGAKAMWLADAFMAAAGLAMLSFWYHKR